MKMKKVRSTFEGFVLGVQRIINLGMWDDRRCFSLMLSNFSHRLVMRYVIPEAAKDYHAPGVKPFLDLMSLAIRALDSFATKQPSEVLQGDQSIISIRVCDFNGIVLALADQSMEAVQCAVRVARASSELDQYNILEQIFSASQSDIRRH
jgi:hypothetical protein